MKKKNFYHGIFWDYYDVNLNGWVQSNIESGDGFVDILIEPEDPDAGIIIELKYAQTFIMDFF